MDHRTYGKTRNCKGCRYWSEMLAQCHGGGVGVSATKPALPEPVAWLHDVVATDGEPDHALSFAPDNFPLQGVGGFRSIGCQPLYTQAAIDAAVADYAQALSSALGWPGGISDPVLDWPTLLRYVAEARAVPADWADQIEHRLLTWRQRTMNRSGDRLALNDFMGQDSIDDLIDCVCAPLDCGEAGHDEGRCGNASCLAATTSPAEQPKPAVRTHGDGNAR